MGEQMAVENRFFFKDGQAIAFSPLQVSEGMAEGLQELTEQDREAHLNPKQLQTAQSLKTAITQKRWEVETGGITLPTGVSIATGIDDQNRITSVIANARLAALETVSFKAASGWVTLTLAELESVAAAIAMHVQQCFSAERAHHEAVDALQQLHVDDDGALQQALEAYDVEQGWPASAIANQ